MRGKDAGKKKNRRDKNVDMEKLAEEMSAGIEGASEMAVWLADCIVNRRAQLPI